MSKSFLAVLPLLFAGTAAHADEAATAAPLPTDITVVATGSELRVDESGQAISIVDSEEIASLQGPDLTRVLERLPGVTLTRNGGLGGFTGVRVRGANAEQLLVLVDGVRVADVAAPGGGYDFGNLLSGGLERVELLRGSNSVIWGSDAIGGVMAVTTRTVNGAELAYEYGARDSFDEQLSLGRVTDVYEIGLTGGYTRSDGFSSASSGSEADGFEQWRVAGRSKLGLTEALALTAIGRYSESRLDMDGYPAPLYAFADTPEMQRTKHASGRVSLAYEAGPLTLNAGVAAAGTHRFYYDTDQDSTLNYETHGRSIRADLTGRLKLPSRLAVDFGADSEWTRFSDSYEPRRKARQTSGHALVGYYGDAVSVAAGARIDDHSRFGTEWTFGANGALRLAPGWRVRASYGEGFKTPTLYQLFSSYGRESLQPERSRSYDAGIEYGDRNSGLHFGATVFRRDSRDLIEFVSCRLLNVCATRPFGTYNNVSRARAEGFELEGNVRPDESVTVRAAYSYVKATNRLTGRDLARRPRHAVTVAADWQTPLAGLTLGGDMRMVSDSFDDAGNFTRIDGHAIATVRASLALNDALELYGRVENVADAEYVVVSGYNTPGRSAFVGVRARF